MAGDLNGISFELYSKAQQDSLSYSQDGARSVRVYKVAWSDAENFLKNLVGFSSTSGNLINRTLGLAYGSSVFDLICKRASISDGLGCVSLNANGTANYEFALIKAEFEDRGFDETEIPPNQVGSLSIPVVSGITPANEFLAMPGGVFTADGKVRSESISKLLPKNNIQVTYKNVPYKKYFGDPENNISGTATEVSDVQGKVNSDSVTWIGGGPFLAGTLLFLGASVSLQKSSIKGNLQDRPVTVTYSFQEKPNGWNFVFIPGTGWKVVTPSIFESTLFKDLEITYV